MKINDFAKKTGVTVKALLHYDKLGLLIPERTANGYRNYSEDNILRLQQITTLKYIGLSLKEIGLVLKDESTGLNKIISIQKEELMQKKDQISEAISILENLENQTINSDELITKDLINIIKLTSIENKVKAQYKSTTLFDKRVNLHSYNINKDDWNVWCFEHMSIDKKSKILEIGCGDGSFWIKNHENIDKSWKIILTDSSEAMLDICKKSLLNHDLDYEFKLVDAMSLPFEDSSIDIILAKHVLYLIPDIELALKEMKRVLSDHGKIYISTNSPLMMKELNKLIDNFDKELGLGNNGMCERFDSINGIEILKKYYKRINSNSYTGKIIVSDPEPIVEYKASTITGSKILTSYKKDKFYDYVVEYLNENGKFEISTESVLFELTK